MSAPRIFSPEYYSRLAELEGGGWWNAAMRDAAALLLRGADLPDRGLMVDVGCGTGATLVWFRRARPGWRVVGFDVAREAVGVGDPGSRPWLSMATALALPVPSGRADLVWTQDVLQHLPLPDGDVRALREMWRILRPGGYLFVRTNAQTFPRAPVDAMNDFRRYRPAELRRTLEAAGFETLRLSRLNALLGLAEIPRELRARRREGPGYHGILGRATADGGAAAGIKRGWLRFEGRLVVAGVRLPVGRSIVALCRKPTETEAGET